MAHAPQLVSFSAAPQPQLTAALMQAGPTARINHQFPIARFESVVFHPQQPAAGNSPALRSAKPKLKSKRRLAPATQIDAVYSKTTLLDAVPRHNRQWMILASWQQSASQPVLVTLPDGRTFLATYAARC